MVVGIVRIELFIPGSQSLKDKRQVIRSLKDRLRERLHAAVAEVDHHELWQRAALGLAVVGADGGQVHELLNHARRITEQAYAAQITDWQERLE